MLIRRINRAAPPRSAADLPQVVTSGANNSESEAKVRAEDLKQKAAAKAADLGTQLDTAKADAKSKLDAAAAAKDAAKAAETRKAETACRPLDQAYPKPFISLTRGGDRASCLAALLLSSITVTKAVVSASLLHALAIIIRQSGIAY
jgi:hypothetical protein